MMTQMSAEEVNERDRICKLRSVVGSNTDKSTGYKIELFHSKYLAEVNKIGSQGRDSRCQRDSGQSAIRAGKGSRV
jgi:hypothetical protein